MREKLAQTGCWPVLIFNRSVLGSFGRFEFTNEFQDSNTRYSNTSPQDIIDRGSLLDIEKFFQAQVPEIDDFWNDESEANKYIEIEIAEIKKNFGNAPSQAEVKGYLAVKRRPATPEEAFKLAWEQYTLEHAKALYHSDRSILWQAP